jgi:2'-hydroxyisoflavone reductase
LKLLVIGGTKFVGRAFVAEATERGHEVTVFHRGSTEPEDLPAVEHVHGDRNADLARLAGRHWDALLDTYAFVPRVVEETATALAGSVDLYALVSSLSVHPDDLPVGSTEDALTHQPPFPDTEDVTGETYGPLKVACEAEAERGFPGRCLIIRPGYIAGPHDPTDRFTSYVRRAVDGGEMVAPGPADDPMQVLDVRDLAAFMLGRIEASDSDVYGVVGPGEPLTMRGMLETTREIAGAETTFTWLAEDFLRAHGDEVERWFPMWHPQHPGFQTYDASKAVAAGLRHRPFAETVSDTLAWDRERGKPELRAGLPPERERQLLAQWRRNA